MTPAQFSLELSSIFKLSFRVAHAAILLICFQLVAASPSLEEVFNTASQALRRGDYSAAEQGFLAVLKSQPGNIAALGNLGVVYSKTNQQAKAINIYERALKIAPHEPGLLLNLGIAYFKQEQYVRALPPLREVQQLNPAIYQAGELAATCEIFTGDLQSALKTLDALKATDPNKGAVLYLQGVAYIRSKQPEKAKAAFDELLTSAVSPSEANFLLARAYYDGGHFPEAQKSIEEVLKSNPDYAGARLQLAKILISEREDAKAIEALQSELKNHPGDTDAEYFLGAELVQQQDYAQAIPHLELAGKAAPDSWATYYYLGKANLKTGKANAALPLLQKAAELNPDEESVYYLLGQAYRSLGRSDEAKLALNHVRVLQANTNHKIQESLEKVPGVR